MKQSNIDYYNNYNSIINELSIDSEGKVTCTKAGLARLCGVDAKTIYDRYKDRGILKNIYGGIGLSKPLKPFAGQDFTHGGAKQLPDTLVSAIIQHYAYKGYETAQDSLSAFSGIGFRTWGKQLLGEPLEGNNSSSLDPNLGNHLVTIGKAMTEIGNAVSDLYQRDQEKQEQIDELNVDKKIYNELIELGKLMQSGNYGDTDQVTHYPVYGVTANYIANILDYHPDLRERDKQGNYYYPVEFLEFFSRYRAKDIRRVAKTLRQ